jgi:hypothetical protein
MSPRKDLHWVAEHPERLSKRLPEQQRARKEFYSPSVGGEGQNPSRGLGVCESSEAIAHCVYEKTLQEHRRWNPLRVREGQAQEG